MHCTQHKASSIAHLQVLILGIQEARIEEAVGESVVPHASKVKAPEEVRSGSLPHTMRYSLAG